VSVAREHAMRPSVIVFGRNNRRRRLRLVRDEDTDRPRVRGDCLPGGPYSARPCPFVGCRHHLAIEVTAAGNLRVAFGGDGGEIDVDVMPETCSLDVADDGANEMEKIGGLMNVTRQRINVLIMNAIEAADAQQAFAEWEAEQ
jgi:hypothetical protein